MGSTANPPPASVSLAPFAFDWVGGDIHGLQMLAIQLHGYVPATTDVTTALDRRAGQLTSDDPGGWQGSAASAFAASWSRDALAGGALAAVIGQVSEITGGLAVALSEIENALETQADTAARHGVQISRTASPARSPKGRRPAPPKPLSSSGRRPTSRSGSGLRPKPGRSGSKPRPSSPGSISRLRRRIKDRLAASAPARTSP